MTPQKEPDDTPEADDEVVDEPEPEPDQLDAEDDIDPPSEVEAEVEVEADLEDTDPAEGEVEAAAPPRPMPRPQPGRPPGAKEEPPPPFDPGERVRLIQNTRPRTGTPIGEYAVGTLGRVETVLSQTAIVRFDIAPETKEVVAFTCLESAEAGAGGMAVPPAPSPSKRPLTPTDSHPVAVLRRATGPRDAGAGPPSGAGGPGSQPVRGQAGGSRPAPRASFTEIAGAAVPGSPATGRVPSKQPNQPAWKPQAAPARGGEPAGGGHGGVASKMPAAGRPAAGPLAKGGAGRGAGTTKPATTKPAAAPKRATVKSAAPKRATAKATTTGRPAAKPATTKRGAKTARTSTTRSSPSSRSRR